MYPSAVLLHLLSGKLAVDADVRPEFESKSPFEYSAV